MAEQNDILNEVARLERSISGHNNAKAGLLKSAVLATDDPQCLDWVLVLCQTPRTRSSQKETWENFPARPSSRCLGDYAERGATVLR